MTEQPLQKGLLDAVIARMPIAVVVAEAPSGRVVASNEAAAKMALHEWPEWKGFHHDGRAYSRNEWPLARALQGDTVEREEIRFVRADGSSAFLRVSAAPIVEDGRVVAGITTLIDITNERREEAALSLLSDAGIVGSESLDTGETIRRIAQVAVPAFADLALVYLADSEGNLGRHEAAAADPAKKELIEDTWRRYPPPAAGALLEVLHSGTSQLTPTLPDEALEGIPDPELRRRVRELGMRSVILAPLRASGRAHGVMMFALTRQNHVYDGFDVMLAEELGRRAGTAVEKSLLFEGERAQRIRAERAAERIGHLQALTAGLATALTVDAVAELVTERLTRVVNARGIVLALCRDDEHLEVVRAVGVPRDQVEHFRVMRIDDALPIPKAVAERRPLWMHDRAEAISMTPLLANVPTTSAAWAAIPIELHGRALGALGLTFTTEQAFDEEERNFLLGIAGQCAFAIERARLFESERRAREEAERASRAKDEFLAILSHELRTPMTTVLGWADFIRMTRADDEQLHGPLDALRNSARLQAKLVDDLLDVSRIIAGKLSLHAMRIELTSIVRAAVEDVRMTAEEKGVALETQCGVPRVEVRGDPDRLRQIVTNLLVNGIKFTPKGGRVTASVRDAGEDVEIVVSDTGEGIAPEFLPHVFERFLQGSVGDSRRHAGLGLGLSIVQHLVQRHGGSVRAESEGLGRGATFIVRFPKFRG